MPSAADDGNIPTPQFVRQRQLDLHEVEQRAMPLGLAHQRVRHPGSIERCRRRLRQAVAHLLQREFAARQPTQAIKSFSRIFVVDAGRDLGGIEHRRHDALPRDTGRGRNRRQAFQQGDVTLQEPGGVAGRVHGGSLQVLKLNAVGGFAEAASQQFGQLEPRTSGAFCVGQGLPERGLPTCFRLVGVRHRCLR